MPVFGPRIGRNRRDRDRNSTTGSLRDDYTGTNPDEDMQALLDHRVETGLHLRGEPRDLP